MSREHPTTSQFLDRVAALKLTLPEGITVQLAYETTISFRALVTVPAADIYDINGGECYGIDVADGLTDQKVRNIVSFIHRTNNNWNGISSVDHVLGISGIGQPFTEVGLDVAFVNWAARYGVGLGDIHGMMASWAESCRVTCRLEDIHEAVKVSWSNLYKDSIRAYFPSAYRNMNYIDHGPAGRLGKFQACLWGRKAFAFDFTLKDNRYQSSNRPTLIIRQPLPEAAWRSMKGRLVNDIVGDTLFGNTQKVLSVQDHGAYRSVTMTPEIIPLEPITTASALSRKAA